MENLPLSIAVFFGSTTALTVYLFYQATKKSKAALLLVISWLLVQAVISATGFYTDNNSIPPRFALLIGPPILLIVFLFATAKGRRIIDGLDTKMLTYIHTVRLPVEITLFYLFIYNQIPQIMTFEGRNFDVLAGITAPLAAYLYYTKRIISKTAFLIWNIVCLGLVLHIAFTGILSVATPFQQFGFEQPNKALGYFPFIWLPCFIVPAVLLAHFSVLRHLLNGKNQQHPKALPRKKLQITNE